MELRHDWKALNEVLFPRHMPGGQAAAEQAAANAAANAPNAAPGMAVLIERGQGTTTGTDSRKTVCDGVLSDGSYYTEAVNGFTMASDAIPSEAAKYGFDRTLVISKTDLDRHVTDAAVLGANYFRQIQCLREKILGNRKNPLIISRRHFVMDLFTGWLSRLLPRRFNVLVFIDQRSSLSQRALARSSLAASPTVASGGGYRAILLSFSEGKLDQFFEPDFASLHHERLTEWLRDGDLVGQYLENRYLLPCYGVFMYRDVWERMIEVSTTRVANPWRLFVRYYDDGRAAVYPNKFIAKAILAVQRIMVYFGRL
ncbi:MAG: hypothetical protein HYW49_00625 [Deltaproteobacteria bacterium]|nr:hypothetical protein [Deltaproteobacteria bacterium]